MPVIRIRNNRFEWSGTFEDRLLPKSEGWKWDGLNKVWWTDEKARMEPLRKYFVPDDGEEGGLAKVPGAEDSYAVDTDFMPPVPEGLSYFPFQRAAIEFMATRDSTLLADVPGAGKTIMASGLVNCWKAKGELDGDAGIILVLCPSTLVLNWKREMERWLVWPGVRIAAYAGSSARRLPLPSKDNCDVAVMSYDSVWRIYKGTYEVEKSRDPRVPDPVCRAKRDAVPRIFAAILDEAHFCKNFSAKRTLVSLMLAGRASKRVFASGTPMLNRPIELWPLLSTLSPSAYPDRIAFSDRYCDRRLEYVYKRGCSRPARVWVEDGATNLDELNAKLRRSIMIRREREDILPQLPGKTVGIVPVSVPCREVAEEMREWRQMERAYGTEEAVRKLFGSGAGAGMAEFSAIRRRVAEAKAPHVASFVANYLEQGEKVVVMAHHRSVVSAIGDALKGWGVVTVVGGMSAEAKQEAVDAFQNDPKVMVAVCNIRAAGVGITLTASHRVVFAEVDYTPGVLEQAEDRCYRIGQKEHVDVSYVVLEGSLDSYLLEMVRSKQDISETLLR